MKKLTKLSLAILATHLVIGSAYADFAGSSSNENKVRVGKVGDSISGNSGTYHSTDSTGDVAIAVIKPSNSSKVVNKYVGLAGLKAKAEQNSTRIVTNLGGLDSAGIVQLDFNKWSLPSFIPDHKPLGKFSYKELPNNVYFGEWHQGSTTNDQDTDRTVFYVGKDTSANNLPSAGTVVYTVTGINQYNGAVNGLWAGWTGNATAANESALLKGQFTADFTNNELTGTLSRQVHGNATEVTNTLALDGVGINKADASFAGGAIANGAVDGEVKGHFFGNQGATLAGTATFDGNTHLDTAFGGTR